MSISPADPPPCRHCGLPVPALRRAGGGPRFCCFGCRFAHEMAAPVARPAAAGADAPAVSPPNTVLLRLGVGIFLSINLMVASWLSYSRELFGDAASAPDLYASLTGLFRYLSFFLCTVVVALLGLPILGDALARLRSGRVGTQLLIVLGVFSAYVLSAVHTLRGAGSLYYDTAAMVLVIVTLGSYLEAGARRRATASARELLAPLPSTVWVRRDAAAVEVSAAEVAAGDAVRIRPGEIVPADGRVTEGAGRIGEASLTGESGSRSVAPGDRLLAGSVSLDAQLWLEAERVGGETVLAHMERSLAEARARQPPVQRLADRVAAVFVPAVVLLALAVLAGRAAAGDAADGLLRALSVLLISCPCALGLAAPLASWHALRRAAGRGFLIDSAATLERAAAVDRVFFDKTGTLTEPDLAFERVTAAEGVDERQALAWAASLESASTHPIARAVLDAAADRGIEPRIPESSRVVPGLGIEGRVGGLTLRLGSAGWAKELAVPEDDGAGSAVVLMDENRVLARFDLREAPRPEAAAAVAALRRMGISPAVLSGDREAATRRLAERLGLAAEGGLLPADKVDRLSAARASAERGAGRLAMVGDGLNDAPVLAAADVGIAMGSASDLARRSGNVRLTSDRLDRVPEVFALARHARRRIRANLAFAFGFNTVGILLAAGGWLTPVFAAAAMVVSSLIVVRVSSRAGDFAPAPQSSPPGALRGATRQVGIA